MVHAGDDYGDPLPAFVVHAGDDRRSMRMRDVPEGTGTIPWSSSAERLPDTRVGDYGLIRCDTDIRSVSLDLFGVFESVVWPIMCGL